jgi:predicted HTH domain antitoxin
MGIINTELDENWLKELEENAKRLSLDQNALAKKLIIDGLKQLRIQKLLPLFELGEISMEQLAKALDLSIYELLQVLKNARIAIGSDRNQTQQELQLFEERLRPK